MMFYRKVFLKSSFVKKLRTFAILLRPTGWLMLAIHIQVKSSLLVNLAAA